MAFSSAIVNLVPGATGIKIIDYNMSSSYINMVSGHPCSLVEQTA